MQTSPKIMQTSPKVMQTSPKVMQISPKIMQTSPKVSIQQHALNQRSPAEGKGKGQQLLAQGNTLGMR